MYAAQAHYAEAEHLHKRSLAIRETALGPGHPHVATSLNNLALLYRAIERYSEAEPLFKRSISILETALGPDHPGVATSLNNLALVYFAQARYAEVELPIKRSLAIFEKTLGPDHPNVGQLLNNLAYVYGTQGRYTEAEPLFKRSLAIREKALGPDHPNVGESLNNLALLYQAQGRYAEAEPLFKRALAIHERALGPGHPNVAGSVNTLAELYLIQGRYTEAEPLYKRGVAILENSLGSEHSNVGAALNSLALLYQAQGRFSEAERLYKRSLAIREKALGPDHPEVSTSLNSIAELYRDQGRYVEAEPLYMRSLSNFEKALGPEHLFVATTLNNLALLYQAQGRFSEAERLYKRSLAINETVRGPEHPEVATSLNNLATLYQAQARYAEVGLLIKRSLAILEKALGPDHPKVGLSLSNLAFVYGNQGRYTEAEPLHKRSLAIREKALGPDHPNVGESLNHLALLYQAQGRYAEAEPLLMRSLAIREKTLGPDHPDVGQSLNNLAGHYYIAGRHTEAEQLYKRAVAIFEKALGPDHPNVGAVLNYFAEMYLSQRRYGDAEPLLKRSFAIREGGLGPDHPEVGATLNNLGGLAYLQGDWAGAVDLWRRSTAITRRRAERGLADGQDASRDEERRLAGPFLGLVKSTHRLAAQDLSPTTTIAAEMFETAQWAQGSEAAASLAQMAARSAKGSPQLAGLVRERQDLVSEWQAKDKLLIAAKSEAPAKRKADAERALTDRLAAIDIRLAEIGRRFAQDFPDHAVLASPAPASVAEVQPQLGADEALVLFLDTPEWKPTPEETFIWVVTKSDLRWMRSELGTTALTREVAALRCGLDATAWDGDGVEKCANALGVPLDKVPSTGIRLPFDHARAHKLYAALFGPIQNLIKGKQLLIVPSGPLTQLPFQVLVTKQPTSDEHRKIAWLARDHAITILPAVSSLKALRRVGKPSTAPRPMIGFGNPLLDGPDARYANRAKLARDKEGCLHKRPQTLDFAGLRGGVDKVETRGGLADVSHIKAQVPLPETADELCAVAQDVKADASSIRLGVQATEREIKQLSASGELAKYRMLHFATHGVLAGQLDGTHEPGLILTPPDKATEEDDGYLSASEIAALKLDADWVILSACNTAAGAATSAEALSGLARAFIYAQARALLVSHWEVYSDATVKLITTAVREMARDPKVGRAEALRRSMLALIDKGEPHEAHPAYWAPFVVVGEGGIEAGLTTAPTTVTNMKKVPTAAKNQKPAPRPKEDWRVEVLR